MPHLWYGSGIPRTRISTTVDAELLARARQTRSGLADSALIDEALAALLARQRTAEIDAAYAAYDAHPLAGRGDSASAASTDRTLYDRDPRDPERGTARADGRPDSAHLGRQPRFGRECVDRNARGTPRPTQRRPDASDLQRARGRSRLPGLTLHASTDPGQKITASQAGSRTARNAFCDGNRRAEADRDVLRGARRSALPCCLRG
jgi:hypothetical protein